jgi:heme-degrading monooxygenase HmoA
MPVIVQMTAPEMEEAQYDEAAAQLSELVKKQPGFMMHLAYRDRDDDGFIVAEIWETLGQFEAWYTEYVEPRVPGIFRQATDLYSIVLP